MIVCTLLQAATLKLQALPVKPGASSLKLEASSLKLQAPSLRREARSLKLQAPSLKREARRLKLQAPSLKREGRSLKREMRRLKREEGRLRAAVFSTTNYVIMPCVSRSAGALQMQIGEIHVAVPVVAGHIVFAGADVVADGAEDRLRQARH